jgi:chemotaxis signal transduction protein
MSPPPDPPYLPPAPTGAPPTANTALPAVAGGTMPVDGRELCLLCRAGDERVAVRTSDVQKVTTVGHISRLPRLTAAVVGITQHRGRVVTVVDARRALFLPPDDEDDGVSGRSPTAVTVDERLLILERPARHIGLRVDFVDEIEPLALGRDLPAGPGAGLRVVQHRGRALAVLDLERFARAIGVVDARPPRRG